MESSASSAACPLCGKAALSEMHVSRGRRFFSCGDCGGAFLDPRDRLAAEAERARYLLHRNDVNDSGYRLFVSPLVEAIAARQERSGKGLDFGCGTGSAASKMLEEMGYRTRLYDPFFRDDPEALASAYDFIVCCEVMEHFFDPATEFSRLKRLLVPGGGLYCMTEPLRNDVAFDRWYYKEDPTHVFFYSEKTIRWIAENFGFSEIEIHGRLMIFRG